MRTSYITPAIVKALHIVLEEAGGSWLGNATALHTHLAETLRGPLLKALPITPTGLTRVLNEIAAADEDDYCLRVPRVGARWQLRVVC